MLLSVLRILAAAVLFFAVSGFTDCYKPVTSTGLPSYVKKVAVPAFQFEAKGMRYRVESRFTEAVTKEIIRRGNGLRVQGSRDGADAVVEGTIRDFTFSGVLLDRNGRARVYEVTIVTAVTVRDLHDNKILYDNQNLTFRDSFEFSDDPRSFFNEEDPAVELPHLVALDGLDHARCRILERPGESAGRTVGRGVVPMPALVVIGLWIVLQFINGVGSITQSAETGGVAYMAHIGGFVAGLVLTFLFGGRRSEVTA